MMCIHREHSNKPFIIYKGAFSHSFSNKLSIENPLACEGRWIYFCILELLPDKAHTTSYDLIVMLERLRFLLILAPTMLVFAAKETVRTLTDGSLATERTPVSNLYTMNGCLIFD